MGLHEKSSPVGSSFYTTVDDIAVVEFSLPLTAPPVLTPTSTPLEPLAGGPPLDVVVAALSDIDHDSDTVAVTASGMPTGLDVTVVNDTGQVTATVTADAAMPAGTYAFALSAADACSGHTEAIVQVEVRTDPRPEVLSITRTVVVAETNAASVDFNVLFSEPVSGVDSASFALTTDLTAMITQVASADGEASDASWTVTVSTSDGEEGPLRLDFVNSSSATDSAGQPVATTFSSGESYDVDRVAPWVVSITRGGAPKVTNAAEVVFEVTFSETVTNVGPGAFTLQPTFNGAGITTVISAGLPDVLWHVTVDTGSGEGVLGMAVLAAGGVADSLGNLLQEESADSETYTVRRLFADGFESGDLTAWSANQRQWP